MTADQAEKFIRRCLEISKVELTPKQTAQLNKEIRSFYLFPDFLATYESWWRELVEARKVHGKSHTLVDTNHNNLITPYITGITSCPPVIDQEPTRWSQFGDCPDIDTDIEDRDAAYTICQEIFGKERVGAVSSFTELKLKMAITDVCKLYKLPPNEVKAITTKLSKDAAESEDLNKAIQELPALESLLNQHKGMREDIEALLANGPYRSVGRHAGGYIIADNLQTIAPVFMAGDVLQVGYSKKNCEKLGLIKLDLLGLLTLRMISDAIHEIIHHHRDEWREKLEAHVGKKMRQEWVVDDDGCMEAFDPFDYSSGDFVVVANGNREKYDHRFKFIHAFYDLVLSPEVIDFNDQNVYETVYNGNRYCGVFQMESEGMRRTASSFKPNCIGDISAAVAIYRPGPLAAGVHELYATNKLKWEAGEKVEEHPIIDKVLEPTYGLIVYQEQIMQLGAELGKYEPKQVQRMRQNIIKYGKEKLTPELAAEREALKAQFLKGSEENGYPVEKAQELWEKIEAFASYSFNLSHSFCYGVVSFITAYLLTYHKLEWYTAVLNNSNKSEKMIAEVLADKVELLPPDIIESRMQWSISNGKIRFGLGNIDGVGEKAAINIIEAQRGSDKVPGFDNVWSFFKHPMIQWKNVNTRVIGALVRSGCFDSQKDEIFQHFANMRCFHDTIVTTDYRKLFISEPTPEEAIQKILDKKARYDTAIAKWETESQEFENGTRDKLKKMPKEPPIFFDLSDWSRYERVEAMTSLLGYLPPPEFVEYRQYRLWIHSQPGMTPPVEQRCEIVYSEKVSTDEFIRRVEADGMIAIDEHPNYHNQLVPKCWFRIAGISRRQTAKGAKFLIIHAAGKSDTIEVKCWQPEIFDGIIPSDFAAGYIEYDEKWGYSVTRSKPPKLKYPIVRFPAMDEQ